MSRPLLVRPGTSDVRCFRDVWIEETYKVELGFSPELILDLGAYTGLSTRWFLDRFPGVHVVAVEPNPEAVELLKRNAPEAEIYEQAAVGPAPGVGAYFPVEGDAWRGGMHGSGRGCRVDLWTVDEILGGRTPDVVKMDIEGSEREVFGAGGRWLREVRVIHLETHDRFVEGCTAAVRERLREVSRPYRTRARGGADSTIFFEDHGS